MPMRAPWILVVVLLAAGLGGCTDAKSGSSGDVDRRTASQVEPVKGRMTGHETTNRWSGACPSQVGRFCATYTLWAEGDIDLQELPVILETTNGDLTLEFSNGPDWNLTILATATNKQTLDEARQTAENLLVKWSHEESGGHFLRASARAKTPTCNNNCPRISIVLRLPDNVLIRAELDSTNGDVTAGGHQYPSLVAATTNGRAILRDSITRDVTLDTTNGDVEIRSRPYGSGTWTLDSTNGGIRVWVPEEPAHGYEIEGDTSNGEVVISLRDGTVSGTSRAHKSFETHGYLDRSIRTGILADTTNGGIAVGAYR